MPKSHSIVRRFSQIEQQCGDIVSGALQKLDGSIIIQFVEEFAGYGHLNVPPKCIQITAPQHLESVGVITHRFQHE